MKTIDIAILKAVNSAAEDAELASTYRIRTALYRLESRGLIVQFLPKRYRITAAGELLLNGGRVQEVNAPFPLRYSRNILLFAGVLLIRHWWVQGFDSTVLRSLVTNTVLVLVCLWQKQKYLKAIAGMRDTAR